MGKPILIIRETTERPEIVEAGAAEIVGSDKTKIMEEMLNNEKLYERMSKVKNPYGDGKASSRIISRLLLELRMDWDSKKKGKLKVEQPGDVFQKPAERTQKID